MIAKTTVGSSFEGALTYGAGQRPGRKSAEAELLGSSNLREGTPQVMARQMEEVARESARIQKPVWHTSLSWPPGETVTREQKVAAAEMYCDLMGAPFDRHQVAIYEHHDKPHEHIHIYINRVPIDAGPALRTSNNFYKQPKVCKEICEKLGMQQLPDRKQREQAKLGKVVPDANPAKQARRVEVRAALDEILAQPSIGRITGQGVDWLMQELQQRQIAIKYTHDAKGILRGVSFTKDGLSMTGQEAGYKAAHLLKAFEAAVKRAQQGMSESTKQPLTQTLTAAPTAASGQVAVPAPTVAPEQKDPTPAPAATPAPRVVPPTVSPADEDEAKQTERKTPRRRL
jgi:hypothetical protein